eukprot:TRINITY_DN11015_c0_g1_i2.p1 TRINITY_DN11015_c0_g1~~TRINITY_DN11015_c0_g1_i2.p1  ORF type:complete len:163 (+),score=26.33 TRINITY_DN11015_c0_g1_i2:54-542(+)
MSTGSWSKGLCSCCDDCSLCCDLYFCGNCDIARMDASLKGEQNDANWCCCIIISCLPLASCIALCQQRAKIRGMYGIDGGCPTDFLATFCCGLCAASQQYREMTLRGLNPGYCCCKPKPVANVIVNVPGGAVVHVQQGQPVVGMPPPQPQQQMMGQPQQQGV